MHVNANCLEELDRIQELGGPRGGTVGIRVNPLVGSGKIEELSVSTLSSKFGVALTEANKAAIVAKFRAYPWLTGLHIHVGSQVLTDAHTAFAQIIPMRTCIHLGLVPDVLGMDACVCVRDVFVCVCAHGRASRWRSRQAGSRPWWTSPSRWTRS
jgi:hypothetical protein